MLRLDADRNKRQLPKGLALFLCLFSCLSAAACSRGETPACSAPLGLEGQPVAAVTDGDTLRLANGDKVRLIGINTPELGYDGAPSEPLARRAQEALGKLLAGGEVRLQDGIEPYDRHGRRLAHAFDESGRLLAAQLLRQGLGFQVAIAPNFNHLDCLRAAEVEAAAAGLGVWSQPAYLPRAVADLAAGQRGFLRLRDEVTRVSFKRNGWWVQLAGKVGLRLDQDGQSGFSRDELRALQGQVVEARGWLVPMNGGWWLMNINHPLMLTRVD